MSNFKPLNEQDETRVWERFYQIFQFHPSTTSFPGIKTEKPHLRLDISKYIINEKPGNELETIALKLFATITKPGERLYALDWQHECYDFDPRMTMERNEFDEWLIPIIPKGDYYIFLDKDFENVWFGHPWEQTITLIGLAMVHGWEEYGLKLPELPDA